MGQFDRQIATARRLIAKNGELCSWRSLSAGVVVDPLIPWQKSNGVDVGTDVRIVYLPRSRVNTAFLQALGKTSVSVGMEYGLMAAVSFTPKREDYVIRASGDKYKINAIDRLAPNGQIILYTIDFDK